MEQRSSPARLGSATEGKPRMLARDISESLGKLPPQSIELEEAILGAIIFESPSLDKVISLLRPEHFYLDAHKEIYSACLRLHDDRNPVDSRTVVSQLRKEGKLEIVGGAYYIAELVSKVSSSGNIEYYARVLMEYALKRDLIQLASQVHHNAYEDETDVFELMDSLAASLLQLGRDTSMKKFSTIRDGMIAMMTDIGSREHSELGLSGVASGFNAIDRITHGWQASDLIILAARPGMGKTSLALSMMRNMAILFGVPVGFASLEMALLQLTRKLAAMESELPLRKIKGEKFNPLDYEVLNNRTAKLANAPIYIDDSASMTVQQLHSVVREMVMKYGIKVMFVDYVQLLRGDVDTRKNREQEIASITRALKQMTKEFNIVIIALSQLSREVEKRGGNKIPQLSDLRESGSLEQDSDVVVFLWRPEYYKITGDDDGEFCDGITKVIFAKHRNGSLSDAFVQFVGQTTEFRNAEYIYVGKEPVPQPGPQPAGKLIPMADAIAQQNKTDDDMPF